MRKAVWGTGVYAGEFAYTIKRDKIDLFIDNDKKKSGQYFYGKKIVSPDEIKDWSELYIYIPFNFYEEIKRQLQAYGLTDQSHYEKYYDINSICALEFEEDYIKAIEKVKIKENQMKGFNLFWGRGWALSHRGFKEFIQEWKKKDGNLKLGIVSEAIWCSQEETEDIMGMPSVVAPGIFDFSIYIRDGKLTHEQEMFLKDKDYALDGSRCLKVRFPGLTQESADYMVYYMYQYIIKVLEGICPKLIIVNGLINVQHLILQEVCQKKRIPLIATHQGVLPGTLSFDIGGEMGESLPSIYSEKFKKLPVCKTDMEQAKKVWNYLYKSKLNRKIQPKNNCIEYILKRIKLGRPTVFFAGQSDISSGMCTVSIEKARIYHSPIFKSSVEAGIYIADLCKKNDWNYIYKPHPLNAGIEKRDEFPDNTIYIEFGDINSLIDISDVTVTILSQTNYICMIRHKPVVMLGYNQTKGTGCTYESFEKDKIEYTIRLALKDGFSKKQEQAFLIHIAQLIRYYLYDDLQEREIRYGRKIPDCIEEFYELKRLLNSID